MNREEEKERPVLSDQDNVSAREFGTPVQEGEARPGVTDVQAYIGRQLRAVYDDVAKQPIPDRFLMLMKQLEDQAAKD